MSILIKDSIRAYWVRHAPDVTPYSDPLAKITWIPSNTQGTGAPSSTAQPPAPNTPKQLNRTEAEDIANELIDKIENEHTKSMLYLVYYTLFNRGFREHDCRPQISVAYPLKRRE